MTVTSTPARPRHGVRVAHVLARLVALVAFLVVAAAVVVVLVLPRVVHGEAMTVLTGSMSPAMPAGSVAVVRPVDPQTVKVGDVITYQVRAGEEVFITHRVIDVREEDGQTLFVLQGDANDAADDPVLADRIRGEVWFHVPYLGAIRDTLHGRGGMYLVATLLLAWFAVSQIGAGLRERRDGRGDSTGADAGAGPDDEQSPGTTVVLDRPLALVRIDRDLLDRIGLDPEAAARQAGGVLVGGDDQSCQVLLAPAADEVDEVLDRLGVLRATDVELTAPGGRLVLPESAPHPTPISTPPR